MTDRYVAVYHDDGAGEFSRGCLTYALASSFAGNARVRRIYASEICASDAWHADTLLLALPGGADLPYCAKLDGAGNASIRRFIEAGGAFLGVCAGAYYACARIAFESASADAITGVRELALFAGTACGSLHELAAPFEVDHLHCTAVVRVRAAALQRDFHALYWGGPELLPDRDARYEPILHYIMPDGREALAAVRTNFGKGRAVLIGVHAEIMGCQFPFEVSRHGNDSFDHGMRVSAELTRLEPERQQLWNLVVSELGFQR